MNTANTWQAVSTTATAATPRLLSLITIAILLSMATPVYASPDLPVAPADVLIPHKDIGRGDLHSETVAAAGRLVGLKDSFNHDSFIAHIIYVTALSGRDIFPADKWASRFTRKVNAAGRIHRKGTPRPGDLVFFSLSDRAPHSAKASNVMVGVVEKVSDSRITFIMAGSRGVQRGTMGIGKARVKETRLKSCKPPPPKKEKSAKTSKKSKSTKKSGTSKKSTTTKKGSATKKAKSAKPEKLPCTTSELYIGFADIEDVALTMNPKPPTEWKSPEAH
ncbi:MAG TPA: CHAP domain-containing protein [Myxococcota bacterium]|nr:CHAP domain-containing protein [Myxococcota bacterium]